MLVGSCVEGLCVFQLVVPQHGIRFYLAVFCMSPSMFELRMVLLSLVLNRLCVLRTTCRRGAWLSSAVQRSRELQELGSQ